MILVDNLSRAMPYTRPGAAARTVVGKGLIFALYEWYRNAELTSDRAGLLCVQEYEPCVRTGADRTG